MSISEYLEYRLKKILGGGGYQMYGLAKKHGVLQDTHDMNHESIDHSEFPAAATRKVWTISHGVRYSGHTGVSTHQRD